MMTDSSLTPMTRSVQAAWPTEVAQHSKVRAYIRQSTLGLWGKRRELVQAELLGHVGARVHELAAMGTCYEVAIQQTLEELGAPRRVRDGMVRLYTLPIASLLFTAIIALVVFTSHGTTAVMAPQIISMKDVARCGEEDLRLSITTVPDGLRLLENDCQVDQGQTWISRDGLSDVFEASSAMWTETARGALVEFEGASPIHLTWGPEPSRAPSPSSPNGVNESAARNLTWSTINVFGQDYLSVQSILRQIITQSDAIVRLEASMGGGAPRLVVGETSLALNGFSLEAVHGMVKPFLTRRLLSDSGLTIASWGPPSNSSQTVAYEYEVRAKADGDSGPHSMFAIAFKSASETLRLELLQPGPNGLLRFSLPWSAPIWVENPADLNTDRAALIVRLTGILNDGASMYEPWTLVLDKP